MKKKQMKKEQMNALTKDEIAFLTFNGVYNTAPEWSSKKYPDEHPNKKLYNKTRNKLIKRGFIKIVMKGEKRNGGYEPADWDFTPFGAQLSSLLRSYADIVTNIKHTNKKIELTIKNCEHYHYG